MQDDSQNMLRRASNMCKQGHVEEGMALIRQFLRTEKKSPEDVDRAGRIIQKTISAHPNDYKPLKIMLVGQFTTSWLLNALAASAWEQGVATIVSEGGYDTVLQDLAALSSQPNRPDVIVLLPWNRRIFGGENPTERVADEVGMWRQAWNLITEGLGSRILQVGYDWMWTGALGAFQDSRPGGRIHAVRAVNELLLDQLPPGAYFLDLAQVSGGMGREQFYNPRRYYWTKQPFSEAGSVRLANELFAGVRALTTGPKKVVVLDLDNTLWGGVVGETGPLGVALGDSPDGEGFRAFQTYLKELSRRGILLAVSSKNNPADAREVFEQNPDSILKLDDFAAFEANWEPKAISLRRIAETLNLGLDSFVFFDDNPAERELIRQAIPDVQVVDVPVEPAEYVRALAAGGWFETTGLTSDDAARSSQYVVERQRRELKDSFTSLDDYLRSLEMWADVRPIDETDLLRVVQLLSKTNQFNLTTRRHTREDVLQLLSLPGSVAMTMRMEDRFGDYGLVSLMMGVPTDVPGAIRIDTWLMSCRVIGRTSEQFLFGLFMNRAKELGYSKIFGEYIQTKKNALVSELYDSLGFTKLSTENSTVRYELPLAAAEPPVAFINLRTPTLEEERPSADQAAT